MHSAKTFWILLLVLIIATFLRTYHFTVTPPGLYPDEAMNGNNALEAFRTGAFKVYYPENNGREGLFIAIQAGFLKFIGENEPWVLRLPSALFGILTVLGLYFLAKELFGKRVALLSAFFLATSFWHVLFSRIGFRAIMAPFFLVWAFYFLFLAFRRAWGGRWSPAAAAAGVLYGLGFYTYIAYRITPLLLLFLVPFFMGQKNFWKVAAVFLGAAFLVALPLGLYYLQYPGDFFGRTAQISVFSSPTPLKDLLVNTVKTLGMFHVTGDWNWRHNYAGRPEFFWPVGALLAIGAILGAVAAIKNFRRINSASGSANEAFPPLFLFAWLIAGMLPVVISSEGLPHALRAIMMLPPLIMLAAAAGVRGYDHLSAYLAKGALGVLATLFFILLTLEAFHSYFVLWAGNPNVAGAFSADYVALGRKLNELPAEVPKYVVVEAGGVPVRGIPMPAQTVMFVTDTYLSENQEIKNLYYVTDENQIPTGALRVYLR